jgi:predicted DNA-binding antitoxin AbrB/MazE fold protein
MVSNTAPFFHSRFAPSQPTGAVMSIVVEAVYEDGVLKPKQPLPLQEHETVRLTVEPHISWARRTAGMLQWTGDPKDLERLAEDPDLEYEQ